MVIDRDTICAPISARGRAGVSVLRVSGSAAKGILQGLTPQSEQALRAPRKLIFGPLYDIPQTLSEGSARPILDHGLVAFFPGPKSFTGEDCFEVHLHGSTYLVARLLEHLQALGARLARPGEFTERAFLNGKIDLTQAEAVGDLISAETEMQAKVAREHLEGRLSQAVSELGEPLRNLLAEIEAHIDFPEEDIEPLSYHLWSEVLRGVKTTIERYIASYRSGKICRDGALVVLAGRPNAGKSSLLNQLIGEDRAIVTDIPGTTRDSIEESASIEGLLVRFCDTAGLESKRTLDPVEALGVERSWKKIEQADLLLYVFDASLGFAEEEETFQKVREHQPNALLLGNKSDLLDDFDRETLLEERRKKGESDVYFVSAKDGNGIEVLRWLMSQNLLSEGAPEGSLLIANERHVQALKKAKEALEETSVGLAQKRPAEFVAVDLRNALGALEDIIGVTHTEDILGRIFSKFCIGK